MLREAGGPGHPIELAQHRTVEFAPRSGPRCRIVMSKENTTDLLLDFGPDGKTLLPVVTQDARTKEVLILSFLNKQALDETRASGFATYWSRTRNELWKKGATSGDMLKIEEIRVNCEQNSLLFLVTPQGKGACHAKKPDGMPYKSCYYRRIRKDDALEIVEP
jgi:phosphoribosyl-AMP cyclohydrolase